MKGRKLSIKERKEKLEKDKEYRARVLRELERHLAEGYSMESFAECSVSDVTRLVAMFPEEFDSGVIDEAKRKGRQTWETIGKRQATGDCLGNSRTWFYNMANRYGWRDKLELEAEHKGSLNVNVVSYANPNASK